jgi:ABC-type transport system involved in multi-copper enzyme maturation permease subunit
MTCLIWRQHRGQLLWTGLFLVALCGLTWWIGLSADRSLAGYQQWLRTLRVAGCPSPDQRGVFELHASCHALMQRYPHGFQDSFATTYNFAIPAFEEGIPAALVIIGALIGAPLVAREIEQRTQLVSWTQSASRRRWYVTKVAVLAAALSAVGLVAGIANGMLQHPLTRGGLTSSRWVWFYSIDLALVGEILLAFALAVALGAWLRRTLPAVGAALVVFLPLLLASGWAVRNLTPTQRTTSPSHISFAGGGWGIQANNGVLYHPASQYWPLQLTLLVILLAIAAALLAAGWHATRTRAV